LALYSAKKRCSRRCLGGREGEILSNVLLGESFLENFRNILRKF
jgi:hypothetical protein